MMQDEGGNPLVPARSDGFWPPTARQVSVNECPLVCSVGPATSGTFYNLVKALGSSIANITAHEQTTFSRDLWEAT